MTTRRKKVSSRKPRPQAHPRKISIDLEFEPVQFPPFKDVLVLGLSCPHGKRGISRCFSFMCPDDYDLVEITDSRVEAILINKELLTRLTVDEIVNILKINVFPSVNSGDIVRVDFKVRISLKDVEIDRIS